LGEIFEKGWQIKWQELPNGSWIWTNGLPEPELATLGLNKGDFGALRASNRKFKIIDERKDEKGAFEELCEFEDDPRHPVWVVHSHLATEVKDVNKKDGEPDD
jgi:hypothetical protein